MHLCRIQAAAKNLFVHVSVPDVCNFSICRQYAILASFAFFFSRCSFSLHFDVEGVSSGNQTKLKVEFLKSSFVALLIRIFFVTHFESRLCPRFPFGLQVYLCIFFSATPSLGLEDGHWWCTDSASASNCELPVCCSKILLEDFGGTCRPSILRFS